MSDPVSFINPLAVLHLLQHTLRSLCLHENSHWVYAVFWRIIPRNYPTPKWELGQGGGGATYHHDGNRRNWILVWEDGFCNFSESAANQLGECLKPEVFFKMSHQIYNYGEGLMGKVASDYSQQWIHKEQGIQTHSHPRTWEAQFQAGIQTIALIAVREGVLQLGSLHRVIEDLNYVILLRKRFTYIENIPGVLLPHPSSNFQAPSDDDIPPSMEILTPSMDSLEALLSKLPSVVPPPTMLQVKQNEGLY